MLLDISLFRILFAHPGNDQAWLLYAADQVLRGVPLYGSHLIETNPPLIVWVSAIPMQLSLWLHAEPLLTLRALTTALALGSTALCLRLLSRSHLLPTQVVTALAAAAILATELSQHGNDFGQKEHLLILLTLPYLLCTALEATAKSKTHLSLPSSLSLGILAGIGLCLKPQDALILLLFELFLLASTRNPRRLLRPGLLALALAGLAYPLAVAAFAPLYLSQTVPLLSDTYWAFGERSPTFILLDHPFFNAIFLATLLLALSNRHRLRFPALAPAWLAASAGAALAFALQNKNWPYQFYPQQALLAVALICLLLDLLPPGLLAAVSLRSITAATLLALAVTLPFVVRFGIQNNRQVSQTPDSPFLDHTLATLPPGTPVMILSINLMGTSDILADHLTLATRYHHLWMLPAIVRNEIALSSGPPARKTLSAARVRQLSDLQRSNVADDLRTRQPAEVIIPHCLPTTQEPCQGLYGMSFDILAWFQGSPAFATQWANYQHVDGDPFFDVYRRTR
jgi:hypothetical protein